MSQNTRVLLLGGVLVLLPVVGIVTVIVLANRPFAEYDIVSPTALPQFDPFVATQAAQQTQTWEVLLIDVTAAMDTRVQNMYAASLNPTLTPSPSALPPSSTTAQVQSGDCGWMWATQINPELSAEVEQRIAERLPTNTPLEVRVEGFGENCLDRDGSVRYFSTMQTDFRVTIWMRDLPVANSDAAQPLLSEAVQNILSVLADYPVDSTPGPQPGIVSLEFPVLVVHHRTTYWLSTNYRAAIDALNQGLTGKALLDALGGLHQQDEILPT